MSKLGKALLTAIKSAKKEGLVTLDVSPDVAEVRRKLHLSRTSFAKKYHIDVETMKKLEQHRYELDSVGWAYFKCIERNPTVIEQLVNS